jgi:hypothetical protein
MGRRERQEEETRGGVGTITRPGPRVRQRPAGGQDPATVAPAQRQPRPGWPDRPAPPPQRPGGDQRPGSDQRPRNGQRPGGEQRPGTGQRPGSDQRQERGQQAVSGQRSPHQQQTAVRQRSATDPRSAPGKRSPGLWRLPRPRRDTDGGLTATTVAGTRAVPNPAPSVRPAPDARPAPNARPEPVATPDREAAWRTAAPAAPPAGVPDPAQPEASSPPGSHRAPFVVLLCGLLGGALVCALVISTTLAAGSFRITNLQQTTSDLARQRQALEEQVAAAQSAQTIETQALKLGMRPDGELEFIDLKTGKTSTDAATGWESAINVPGYTP